MRVSKSCAATAVVTAFLAAAPASAQTIFQGIGGPVLTDPSTPAGSAKEAFNNFNTAASANPRRISWDGVTVPKTGTNATEVAVASDVTGITTTRFSNVGAFFPETYGVTNDGFAAVNHTVAGQFPAFSGANSFAMFGTNGNNDITIEQDFVVPGAGSTAPAVTRGFGAIFQDVEIANLTSIEYFNGSTSLGKFFVPVAGNGQFSFLGVLFDTPVVTSVSLSLGNRVIFSVDNGVVTSTGAENVARASCSSLACESFPPGSGCAGSNGYGRVSRSHPQRGARPRPSVSDTAGGFQRPRRETFPAMSVEHD